MAVVAEGSQVGGQHAETAALGNTLAELGVRAPHTGRPLTEAMVLGIAGGIGAGYFVMAYGGQPTFYSGTRHGWWDHAGFLAAAGERVGLTVHSQETSSPKTAAKQLNQALASGRSALVLVDRA